MKKSISLFVAVLSVICLFNTTVRSQSRKEVQFYCMNYAFAGMKLELITPSGRVYSRNWETINHNYWMKVAEMKDIIFPVDGRNCRVRIHFRTSTGDTCVANFLLNNYSYSGHALYVMISSLNLAPKLDSNFGPVGYGVRLISQWSYPNDDICIHPELKSETSKVWNMNQKDLYSSQYIR